MSHSETEFLFVCFFESLLGHLLCISFECLGFTSRVLEGGVTGSFGTDAPYAGSHIEDVRKGKDNLLKRECTYLLSCEDINRGSQNYTRVY